MARGTLFETPALFEEVRQGLSILVSMFVVVVVVLLSSFFLLPKRRIGNDRTD